MMFQNLLHTFKDSKDMNNYQCLQTNTRQVTPESTVLKESGYN